MTLGRATGWTLLGQIVRQGAQAVYVYLLATELGPGDYGAFIGVVAIATMMSPLASVGQNLVLVQHASRVTGRLNETWAKAIGASVVAFPVLLAAGITIISLWVLPEARRAPIVLLLVAELAVVPLWELCGRVAQSQERFDLRAVLEGAQGACRLVGVLILMFVTNDADLGAWASIYLASSVGAVAIALATISPLMRHGRARFLGIALPTLPELNLGLAYAASIGANNAHNEADKVLLAARDTASAGIYALGYKVVLLAHAPVQALLTASYPRFFRLGADGLRGTMPLARRMGLWASVYALLVATALIGAAPIVERLLGDQYVGTGTVLVWLSLLPLLKGVQGPAANSLSGAGFQRTRTIIQFLAVGANLTLLAVLLPRLGWRGAAIATLWSEGLLAAILWAAVMVISPARERKTVG